MKLFLFFLKSAPFLICLWLTLPYILGEDKVEELPKTGDAVGNDKVEDTPVELPKTGDVVTTYRTIPVYSNGDNYTLSYGKHYSVNG